MAKTGEVDVIVGDWMAEATMAAQGVAKTHRVQQLQMNAKQSGLFTQAASGSQFAPNFLDCFIPAIGDLKRNGIKLAVNAGGSDTEILAHIIKQECIDRGCPMNVAWIEGDDVFKKLVELSTEGKELRSLNRGKDISLKEWGFEPVAAQAYLGGLGIAEAFRNGADIVICGRVADAAPTIGAAAWWHNWNQSHLDELAGALVAGHLIECGGYVTGENYCNFKKLLKNNKHFDIGFPVVEIDHKGESILTKEKSTGGVVDVGNTISQLVYEIQGPIYYNSDVTADLEDVRIEALGEDRVHISRVKGRLPPSTTKVGITAHGGYQAEYTFYFVGLDIQEKARWTEDHVRETLGESVNRLSHLKFHLHGSSPIDAPNQDAATVGLRIVAQGRDFDLFDMQNPHSFGRKVRSLILESAPGASISNDGRLVFPKKYEEFFVTLFPQSELNQRVHLLYDECKSIDVLAAEKTCTYPLQQRSYETTNPVDLSQYETIRAPFGYVVMARSGDKATDANVGLFVRHDDEWDWLRSLLTTDRFKQMLRAEYKGGQMIDSRCHTFERCISYCTITWSGVSLLQLALTLLVKMLENM
ncbi:hypothetical protein LTS17_001114 [Exophiala oligosperma]